MPHAGLEKQERDEGWPGPVTKYRYRAYRPLFCNEPFRLTGRALDGSDRDALGLELRAVHPERGLATRAELTFRR